MNSAWADVIVGPIGIIAANALLGEITPKMAAAIPGSSARKVLNPVSRCGVSGGGVQGKPLTAKVRGDGRSPWDHVKR